MQDKGARVLIIDDESQIRKMLKVALTAHKYHINEAPTGQDGLNQAALFHPDLIILDLGLPDMNGLDVLRELREWTTVPIIVLSVRESENDKVAALDLGADDYITKPFGMGELLARIRVAIRHAVKSDTEPVISCGSLTIDMAHRQVTVDKSEIRLTPTEYDLLKHLITHAGKVLTHRQLLKAIWGIDYQQKDHYLRVYIRQIRRKIEKDPTRPEFIITEPGVGYRFTSKT